VAKPGDLAVKERAAIFRIMKSRFLPYDKDLKQFSRDLRNNSTLSEILLWMKIKNKQMRGYQFLRQKPLDRYIADFYCQKLNLVLEVDGYSHRDEQAQQEDKMRDGILQSYGLFILRIEDSDVKRNMSNVLLAIEGYVDEFERINALPQS
jgi:very-short-patch-repair endonuclease